MLLKSKEIKSNQIKLTQNGILKQLGFSESTFERYRDDINRIVPVIE